MRLYDARHRHGGGGPPTMLLNQNETKETLVAANIVQNGSAPWPGASDPYAAWLAQDSRVEQDPTVRLIRCKATELGRTVEVTELIAQGAFEALSAATARSTTRFLNVTIAALADQVDVVVLAQVSKERLVPALGALPVPVLPSPRSGVEAV